MYSLVFCWSECVLCLSFPLRSWTRWSWFPRSTCQLHCKWKFLWLWKNKFSSCVTSSQHQSPCRRCRPWSKFHLLRNHPKNCNGSLEKLLDFLQSADKIAMHENDHKDFQLLHQALMVKLYFHIQDVTSRHLDRSRSIQLGFAFQVGHRWSEWFEHSQRRFLKLHRQCLQRVDLRV